MPHKQQLFAVWLVTIVVAYCSIVYELLLAQCLAIVLGQSFLRYTLTIGFYLFSLGMGALAIDYLPAKHKGSVLLAAELALCLLGAAIPWLIFAGESSCIRALAAVGLNPVAGLGKSLLWIYMHSWIFVVGFLSGCEIPLLMGLAEEQGGEKAASYVLGLDYMGTFLGAVSFPFLTYQYLGIIAGAAFTAMLNGLAACVLLVILAYPLRAPVAWLCYSLVVGACVLMYQEEALRVLVVDLFMGPTLASVEVP